MKTTYETPMIEIVVFSARDIITTSGEDPENGDKITLPRDEFN